MATKFVKLRDVGTIIHDPTQDVSITGDLPVEVNVSKRIAREIAKGRLIEVPAAAAKKVIAAAVKAKHKASKDSGNKELQQLRVDNEELVLQNGDLEAKNSELSEANLALTNRVESLEDELAKISSSAEKG